MRVALVLTQDRGGPVDVTTALALELERSGAAEVRIFGPVPARDADLVGHLLEPLVAGSKTDLRGLDHVRRAVRDWRPDVVHAQDRRSGLVASAVALGRRRRRGPAVVHTYHGVPDDVTQPWFEGRPGADRPSRYTLATLTADAAVARAVDRTVVPAATMGRFLRERLRVPGRRVEHVDNGLDLPAPRPVSEVRRLTFVGMLIERKGVDDLLAAAPTVLDALPGAELRIVGDGPERQRLETAARPLGDRVRFLGFRSDVPALLHETDLFVLPSRMEQQPLVLAEAMAAGCLVAATDVGGVAEMVGEGPGRALAGPAEPSALAAAVLRAARADDPAQASAEIARCAHARFSVVSSARHHASLYEQLVRSRGMGA